MISISDISFFRFCWKNGKLDWPKCARTQEDKEGSRKGSPQVHLFQSYARPKSSHKIAFDFLKFSEASEQQRIKHSQRSKLFITIQFIPLACVAPSGGFP